MAQTSNRTTVGAFDVRFFISIALGLIGVYLLVVALVADPDLGKTGGLHANLWTGIFMVVVAAIFALWARWRPMYLRETPEEEHPPREQGEPYQATTAEDVTRGEGEAPTPPVGPVG
jgi:hypothetical protein